MSISIYVAAQREITPDDLEYVALYNGLVERGIRVPPAIIQRLQNALGEEALKDILSDKVPIEIPQGTQTVELDISGEGDVMYGDGLMIQVGTLPPGTVALRIYAMD